MEPIEWDMFASETKDRDWNALCDEKEVKFAVVWMHAEWCAPCRRLEPEVASLCQTNRQARWFDIRVPKDEIEKDELKETWGFTTIPVFFVYNRTTETWEAMKWDTLLFKSNNLVIHNNGNVT